MATVIKNRSEQHAQQAASVIGAFLVSRGVITNEQLRYARREQRRQSAEKLDTILIRLGFVTPQEVTRAYTGLSLLQLLVPPSH